MSKGLVSIGLAAVAFAVFPVDGLARAACECPQTSLDERIAASVYIFSGKPLMFAQIPPGASPFHSEGSMEIPGGVPNDIVTIFQVDTVWKGAAQRRIKVRRSPRSCASDFKVDEAAIVFVQADSAGVLWTGVCSGDAVKGDEHYDLLKADLTGRLKYN
ncbi:MAG: hypothetical protein JWM91_163 [Rhodospirillales bacterium]|nr:hypothetical protein [Rhodospirillales bacterium]